MRPEWVAIGRVGHPYGLRGKVWVTPLSDVPGRLDTVTEVVLRLPGGAGDRRVRVRSCEPAPKNRVRVSFCGVDDRTQAEQIRGALMLVSSRTCPDLPEDTYYVFDLIGMRVFLESGEALGVVEDVDGFAGNDILVLRDAGGRELLLPATREVVREIDTARGSMVVRLLPGLGDG